MIRDGTQDLLLGPGRSLLLVVTGVASLPIAAPGSDRDTTLVYVSRAPQPDIERWRARMGWEVPWYPITDSFDADFGVDEWHGTNAFLREGDRIFRTYFIDSRATRRWGASGATST